jgi:hypothetical protein
MALHWNYWADEWLLGEKVSFDGETRIITVHPDIVELSVRSDLYSAWKRWVILRDNSKWPVAFRVVGGDPTVGQNFISPYFFLMNGWKIKPDERDHTLTIDGTLLVDGGGDPFMDTIGDYNVRVIATIPMEAELIVAQLPEIQFASFEGEVTVDAINGVAGTAYPIGTKVMPVNNHRDAALIAQERGFRTLHFIGNYHFDNTTQIFDLNLRGSGSQSSTFTFDMGSILAFCDVYNAKVTGWALGVERFENCQIIDYGADGSIASSNDIIIRSSVIGGNINIPSNYTGTILSLDCWGGGGGVKRLSIDLNNSNCFLVVRSFSGNVELKNFNSANNSISIDLISGHVRLDETITGGNITLRGTGTFENYSTNTSLNINGLINREAVATAVWDEPADKRIGNNSMGASIRHIPKFTGRPFWVSLEGSDDNAGVSPTNTLRTISMAIELAQPGDSITVKSGIYDESILIDKEGLEIHAEIGARVTGNGGTPVVVNTNNTLVVGLTATPGADKNGYEISGSGNKFVDCYSSGGVIGYHITGMMSFGNSFTDCVAQVYSQTGFVVDAPYSHFKHLIAVVMNQQTKGIVVNGVGNILDDCNVSGNLTAGLELSPTSADSMVIGLKSTSAVIDSGTNNSIYNTNDVSENVWNAKLTDHQQDDSMGKTLSITSATVDDINTMMDIVNKLTGNKVTRSGNVITIYDDDDVTPWREYDLTNGQRVEIL